MGRGLEYAIRTRVILTLLSLILIMPAAAWAGPFTDKGTQPSGQPNGLTSPLLEPNDCSGCHGNDYDPARHIEPYPTWSGSMMANAGRDPIFWAALDVANNDVPGIGDFCLRCHAPHGWLAGRSEPPGGSVDGCGFEGKLDESGKDFEGITCHLCHRMKENSSPPAGQSSVYFENGQFWLDDGDCGGEPCRRGPYDYQGGGSQTPPHVWAHSPYHESSDNCGNCHNVTSPALNLVIGGVDMGIPYPIERTFMEWQQSSFSGDGVTCQSCHMPDETGDPAYACDEAVNNRTGHLPVHQFAGGNTWIPDVLRQEYPNLDRASAFIATRDWARAMLQTAATVEVTAPTAMTEGNSLNVDVKVTNTSGHKLPTGYPEGRRMWLHVEARDGLNALLFESGAYAQTTGVLTEDAQIKVYQAKPGVWDVGSGTCKTEDGGKPQFHFVLNNCYAIDNRLPPAGFTGGTHLETQPVGYTYPETSPGSGILVNYDVTSYSIPVPVGTPSPVSVTATLKYQTISKEYVEFLRDEAVDNAFPDDCIERSSGFPTQSRGEILHDMWETYDRSTPENVASDSGSVNVLVPEPSAMLQLVAGLAGLVGLARRRGR